MDSPSNREPGSDSHGVAERRSSSSGVEIGGTNGAGNGVGRRGSTNGVGGGDGGGRRGSTNEGEGGDGGGRRGSTNGGEGGDGSSPYRRTVLTLRRGAATELPEDPDQAYNLLLEYTIQGKVHALTELLEKYYSVPPGGTGSFSDPCLTPDSTNRYKNSILPHFTSANSTPNSTTPTKTPDSTPRSFTNTPNSTPSSSTKTPNSNPRSSTKTPNSTPRSSTNTPKRPDKTRSISLDEIDPVFVFDINEAHPRHSRNLLHTAVSTEQMEVMRTLIRFGGDVNVRDKMGMTCLHIASRKRSTGVLEVCLGQGDANIVDNEGLLPLHWAASCGNVDNVAALIGVTKNINQQDKQGRTAVHHAALNGHSSVLRRLLQKTLHNEVDVDVVDENGETALVLSLSKRHDTSLSCVDALLEHGADVKIPNRRGDSVLQLCLSRRFFSEAYDVTKSYQNFIKVLEGPIEREAVSYEVVREFVEFMFREHPEAVWDLWNDLRNIVVDCAQELVDCSRTVHSFPLFVKLLKLVRSLGITDVGQVSCKGPVSKRMLSFSPRNPQQEEKLIVNRRIEIVTQNIASHGESSKPDDAHEALDDVWKFLKKWMKLVKSYHTRTRRDSYRFMRRPYEFDANDLRDVAPQLCSLIKGYHIWAEDTNYYKEFLQFISDFSAVLKLFLAFNTELIFGPLDFLLASSITSVEFYNIRRTVLDVPLELRKGWFYDRLYGDTPPDDPNVLSEKLNIFFIDRDKLFTTSCEQVMNAQGNFLRDSLTINFQGDDGMGVGVRREWFTLLTERITDPMYGLFQRYNNGLNFQPNHLSKVNPDHLRQFEFAGKVIALMIYYQNTTGIHFTKCFYKHMLGEPIDSTDVICIDNDLAMSLQWLLDNDISDMAELTFSVDEHDFGEHGTLELKPGGSDIVVTEDNKVEYVHLLSEYKMTGSIKPQINSFLAGFYSIVPRNLLAIFSPEELELILCGLDVIDCSDWRRNTQYVNFSADDDMIVWFWEVLESFSQEELEVLLKFITGYSKVPHGGFSQFAVIGSSGPIKISKGNGTAAYLPKSSVCFNLLMLPVYSSKEMLKDRLATAMSYASVGFDQC